MPVDETPPLPPSHQEEGEGFNRWNCGDSLRRRSSNSVRVLAINTGNFTVEEKTSNKVTDLCALIRSVEANVTTFCEHGLNPKNLPRHEQWAERTSGAFEHLQAKLSWNINEKTTEQRMWGGTGLMKRDQMIRPMMGWLLRLLRTVSL